MPKQGPFELGLRGLLTFAQHGLHRGGARLGANDHKRGESEHEQQGQNDYPLSVACSLGSNVHLDEVILAYLLKLCAK